MTRPGGNQFHGTLFEYLRNDIFDARNYFDAPPLPKPPLRQNDFGGTFAGPIRKDRAFFFFTYEAATQIREEFPDVKVAFFSVEYNLRRFVQLSV